ncbi:transmembrane protein 154 isoform X2 [Neoarius graeffei]|uniref:transmembrane protein 154 isoform X2 n=1 Tax=Neoarius graeffei TaxID=443677 RepID=UPI00298CDC14|nr:transmembrane protein 154 isoform X2 [Neoarius graeffei]
MTEGWCNGTMSVPAQSKGHYCHRGLWEMTPDVLLLILALTACLTESALAITHTPALTNETWNSITVHIQEEDVSRGAETHAQATLEQNSTLMHSPNATHNLTTEVKHKSGPKSSSNSTKVKRKDIENVNKTTPKKTTEKNTTTQTITNNNPQNGKTDEQWVLIITIVCLVLVLLLAAIMAGILIICRRRKRNTAGLEKDDPYLDDEDGEKVPMPMFEDDMPSVLELEMEDFEKWMIKGGSNISLDSKQRHPS